MRTEPLQPPFQHTPKQPQPQQLPLGTLLCLPVYLGTDQVLAGSVWEESEQHVCTESPVVGQVRPVLTHCPLEAEVVTGRPAATPGTDPGTEDQLQTGEDWSIAMAM